MRFICALPFVVIAALAALPACSPFATYPPIEHTARLAPATLPPVAGLMAEAIAHTNTNYGSGRDVFAVNLPPGVPEITYVKVLERLGPGAYVMTQDEQFAYHVTEARVRGAKAEVDVVFPREDGLFQLVTVYLKTNLVSGYRATDARAWRIEVQPMSPNYVPGPDPVEGEVVQAPEDFYQ